MSISIIVLIIITCMCNLMYLIKIIPVFITDYLKIVHTTQRFRQGIKINYLISGQVIYPLKIWWEDERQTYHSGSRYLKKVVQTNLWEWCFVLIITILQSLSCCLPLLCELTLYVIQNSQHHETLSCLWNNYINNNGVMAVRIIYE